MPTQYKYMPEQSPRPPQNSHRLAPVFAVLPVLGFIDDGRLQDFDRVPGASGDNAALFLSYAPAHP